MVRPLLADEKSGAALGSSTVSTDMKQQFRLFRRGWGTYYVEDTSTWKQESLHTRNKQDAQRLVHARNEAHHQPLLNLQIARAYLSAAEPAFLARTWQHVMDTAGEGKKGTNTKARWTRAVAEKPFDRIRNLKLVETKAEHLLDVMKTGTVSSIIFLRRLHNFALDMNWLLAPIIPRKQWPKIKFKEKAAITIQQHEKIVAGESNPELRDYYNLLWYLGGSQTDIAILRAENVDWKSRTISYVRGKVGSNVSIRFSEVVAQILRSRPATGPLFPQVSRWKETDRAKAFMRRCILVGVSGISLHCYRYGWAERAATAGYPERYAQQALGHRSRAVHNAYARRAKVELPALDEYEAPRPASNIISLALNRPGTTQADSATSNGAEVKEADRRI